MVRVTILSRPTPVIPDPTPAGLELTFDDIANVPVAVASSVTDWNTFFDLPTNGSPFTSVEVVGDMVRLIGGSGITLVEYMFYENTHILKYKDYSGCITTVMNDCFTQCYATEIWLSAATDIKNRAFQGCAYVTHYYLPSVLTLGSTVSDNGVFIIAGPSPSGETIQLTIPSALMTCNEGSPDGDIQELQANNTVTIVTV